MIQIWEFVTSVPAAPAIPQKVQFHLGAGIGEEDDPASHRLVQAIASQEEHQSEPDPGSWECVWKIK